MARIAYPTSEELQPATAEALARIRAINVFRMMAWAEGIAPSLFEFVKQIFAGLQLEPRLRQLAIVRVGHLCGSAYELHQHEALARKVGLTEAELACAAGRAPLDTLGERERLVLQFSAEMTEKIRVSEETFARAAEVFTPRELTELAIVASFYNAICRFLETMDIEIEPKRAKTPAS